MSDDAWLTDDVVDAVAQHMNTDHVDDNVVICRGLGGCGDATAATFVSMTPTAARFAVTTPAGTREIDVAFAAEVTERAQVRAEVAGLYHRSAALLGLAPRD